MRLIFMGNPQFAVPSLEKLLSSRHEVMAVVTSPDQPQGRGQKLCSPAVAGIAKQKGLNLIQQDKLSNSAFLDKIRALAASLFIVVAFRILPEELFSIPPQGAVNLHASLLPKYRGAAPIQWALINGERVTGLTTFLIERKVDVGNILLQEQVEIGSAETADELSARMSEIGADLLLKTIDLLERGGYLPILQDASAASPAPKLMPEDGLIDWSHPAHRIVNLIRGLSSKPCAYTLFEGKKLKFFRAEVVEWEEVSHLPGEILAANPQNGLIVKAGAGAVRITEIQMEGRKRLLCADYLRGCPLHEGLKLGQTQLG